MHEWSRRYSRLTRHSPWILGFRRRKRARNVPRRLVLSQPFIDDLPQKSVIGPVRYVTSTTSSGRTQ